MYTYRQYRESFRCSSIQGSYHAEAVTRNMQAVLMPPCVAQPYEEHAKPAGFYPPKLKLCPKFLSGWSLLLTSSTVFAGTSSCVACTKI